MKTIELLSIDLTRHSVVYNNEGFAIITIDNNRYIVFSILYRMYGFIYDYDDKTTYPELLAKLNGNKLEDIIINNVGVVFDLQIPICEVKKFYTEYLISFGYVLEP